MKIYLASESPRRRQLLTQAGIEHEVIPSYIDEVIIENLPPDVLVQTLAKQKAEAILKKISEPGIIIAADTVVCINGIVLNKPKDNTEAFSMLKSLQSRMHTVFTGVALIHADGKTQKRFTEQANVFFRPLSDEAILQYIATGEPMDKAGAYGIQERGAAFIRRVEGDFYTVMGLPLSRVCQILEEWGMD
jgi:septum formation protein